MKLFAGGMTAAPLPLFVRWCARGSPIVLLALLGGCENPFSEDCTLQANPAISVNFLDAATRGRVEAPYVEAIARDGAYADSVRTEAIRGHVELASSREGTYRVEVRAPGYQPFVSEGVRVKRRNSCHVETVYLEAPLVRET